jgi:hypothetical protein
VLFVCTILTYSNPNLHFKAINLIRNLLASHDADPRYKDRDVKARVATLYLPLMDVVLRALPQLYDPDIEKKSQQNKSDALDDFGQMDSKVALAISGSSVYGGTVSPTSEGYEIASKVKDILIWCYKTLHFTLECSSYCFKIQNMKMSQIWLSFIP